MMVFLYQYVLFLWMTQQEMITHPQIVGYIRMSSTYIVTQLTLLYIGYFTLHKSDNIDDDKLSVILY